MYFESSFSLLCVNFVFRNFNLHYTALKMDHILELTNKLHNLFGIFISIDNIESTLFRIFNSAQLFLGMTDAILLLNSLVHFLRQRYFIY